jgi:hypothetical protein
MTTLWFRKERKMRGLPSSVKAWTASPNPGPRRGGEQDRKKLVHLNTNQWQYSS